MTEENRRLEMLKIFAKVFAGLSEAEHLKMRRSVSPWSSLRHIELINTVERIFQVQFSVEDVLAAEDFESLVRLSRERSRD